MNCRRLHALWACGLVAWAVAARAAEAPWCVPAEGEPFRGQFVGADSTWNLRFVEGDTRREMPAADVVAWGALVEPTHQILVVLPGGGLIVVDNAQVENEQLLAVSPTFGKLSLPIEGAAGIIFRPPLDRAAFDMLLSRVAAPGGRGDRLLLENGDELTGTITEMDDNRVVLQAKTDQMEVKIDTLLAMVFDPTLSVAPRVDGLRAVVGFSDGSRVTSVEMVADAKSAQLKLPGGAPLKAPTPSIVSVQILGGRAVYLSDLKPASYRHIPYLQLSWPYQADRSVLSSALRSQGSLYLKGLGMHSPSRLTYELDQPYRRFDAQVAIDDATRGRGSVVFRVFVDDGSGNWQERADSGTVRGRQPPKPISVDLAGARRISLLVDFADRGDELDHADWLSARLVR